MTWWVPISMACSAICWAAASVLEFRYGQSIFQKDNASVKYRNFWHPVFSHNNSKQIFGYKVDAFHLFQSAAIIFFSLPAAKALDWHPTRISLYFIDLDFIICLAIVGTVWNIVFPNAYGKIFTRKN